MVLDELFHELEVDQVVDALVLAVGEPLRAGVDLLRDLVAQRETGDLDGPVRPNSLTVNAGTELPLVRATLRW